MSDRPKYRHKGYQDSGVTTSKGPRGPRPPEMGRERLEDAPRGRTAGGFGPEVFKCARCGEPQHAYGTIEFEAVCAKCKTDLHTCTNCKNFDTSVRWECREHMNIPARVPVKDLRNECPLMSPRITRDLSADKGTGRVATPDNARKAFDALFKK